MTVAERSPGGAQARYASWVRSEEDGGPLLTVVGEIDFACAGPFAAALVGLAAENSDVAVDMSGVAFIDAAALDAVQQAHRFYETLGLGLVVRAPSRPVRRLLGLTNLTHLIEDQERRGAAAGQTRDVVCGP